MTIEFSNSAGLLHFVLCFIQAAIYWLGKDLYRLLRKEVSCLYSFHVCKLHEGRLAVYAAFEAILVALLLFFFQ